MSDGGGEVGFAKSDTAEEDEVSFLFDEVRATGVLYLLAVDGFGPVPVEGVEGFDDGEAGGFDAPFDGSCASLEGFAFDEAGEVVDVGSVVFCGVSGLVWVVFADPCEFEVVEVFVELLGFVVHALGSLGWV